MNNYPKGSNFNKNYQNNNFNNNINYQNTNFNHYPSNYQNSNNNHNNYNNNNFQNNNFQNYNNNINYNNNYPNNQNINYSYSPNEYNGYNNFNNSINQEMNNYFRTELKSRGINLTRGNSIQNIREQERERKKALRDNIESQIALSKQTKLEELMRKRKEDEQYLKDMEICFPFGRGGGGAPVRDKNGSVVATRRALISDPKYNLVQINVDDDYYDVWGRDKKFGLVINKNNNFGNNARSVSARNIMEILQNLIIMLIMGIVILIMGIFLIIIILIIIMNKKVILLIIRILM